MNPYSMFDYSIGLLQKAEKLALEMDPENGFWLAFSGGKDSQCLYHLAKMAGVKFKAHMNLTSIDPPEVIRFVRQNYPDVELIKPERSIFDMAKKKHLMPTRTIRWCCDIYKEQGGAGKWKEEFVAGVQERAKEVTAENCTLCIGAVYQLEKYLKNPLDTGYQFYMDEQGISETAEQSYKFLRTVSQLEPGTLLYIGGVIDYHF